MAKFEVTGIAASDGIAIAPVYLLTEPDLTFERTTVADAAAEAIRLDKAVEQATAEITQIRSIAAESLGEEEAQVFDAHLMFLSDPEFTGQVREKVSNEGLNAEAALNDVSEMFIQMFSAMEDNAYMQERAADVKDVSTRVLAALLGVKLPSPATISEEVVIIAHDLTPSDTAQLNKQFVKAFVTNIGGRTSHSAIMARSLEIPAIVGTKTIVSDVKDGDLVIVDAMEGTIIVDPTEEQIVQYQEKAKAFEDQKAEWAKLVDAPSETKDGHAVELAANIGTPKDVAAVLENGAEAIGLYRTEFLYMDSADFPTEDEQYNAYREVLEAMNDKPVVVRTMDIGGDKELPYLELPEEMNPFLGYRAIRLCLRETDIFRTQLRALLRASVYGKLAIMFPMIATINEFRSAKAIFEEEKANLTAEGVKVADDIEVGMMVEIPAAAALSDKFSKYADFFSIGTNDLIQYSMAADRMSEPVAYLYQPLNPSILRLIKKTIEGAHANGSWVGMCGAMAGDAMAAPVLLGLGLDEFSMSATQILQARKIINNMKYSDAQALAAKCVDQETMEEVQAIIKEALA